MTAPSCIAVVGSGSWGTAASGLLAQNCPEVLLWCRLQSVADAINDTRSNPRHLTNFQLPSNVRTTHNLGDVGLAQAVVLAVPSVYLRATVREVAPHLGAGVPLCVLTKGIEDETGLLMSDVVADEIQAAGVGPHAIAALSGPNHAEEIAEGMVAAAVVASDDSACSRLFHDLFLSPAFRVYESGDLIGVEVCGAVKNVIALACGVASGLGAGDNTLAVLMTRGIAEVGRIAAASGADPLTCMGLAGMGDLVATCTSPHSRNRSFGRAFAEGESLAHFEERTKMVVEGARAARSARALAKSLGVECPITSAVDAILNEGADLASVIDGLLDRPPHEEFYGI